MSSELWIIQAEIFASQFDPQFSLKKLKELWFRAKSVLSKIAKPNSYDIDNSLFIFEKGADKVGDFFTKWLDGKIQPTDEELDLLEEAFNEASWAYNFLSLNVPPNQFSSEDNQNWQKKIKENKQIVNKEKDKRKQIKNLQSQISSLQNQPKNSDNEARIRDLQRQIDELKKSKPTTPNPQVHQRPTSSPPNNNGLLIGVFCLGFGVCLVLILLIYKKKSLLRKEPKK